MRDEIIVWNSNSLNTKEVALGKLEFVFNFLHSSSPLVLCILEAKISTDDVEKIQTKIDDDLSSRSLSYTCLLSPHESNMSGIIIFYKISPFVDFSPLPIANYSLHKNESHSQLYFLLMCVNNNKGSPQTHLLCFTYFANNMQNYPEETDIILGLWEELLKIANDGDTSAADHTPINVMFLGDFNAKHNEWDTNNDNNGNGRIIQPFMEENEIICLNPIFAPDQVTRPGHSSDGSIIDLAFLSMSWCVEKFNVLDNCELSFLSDHFPISILLQDCFLSKPCSGTRTMHRGWKTESATFDQWKLVNDHLFHLLSTHPLCQDDEWKQEDADRHISFLETSISTSLDLYIGRKPIVKNNKPVWMSHPLYRESLRVFRSVRKKYYRLRCKKRRRSLLPEVRKARNKMFFYMRYAQTAHFYCMSKKFETASSRSVVWKTYKLATARKSHAVFDLDSNNSSFDKVRKYISESPTLSADISIANLSTLDLFGHSFSMNSPSSFNTEQSRINDFVRSGKIFSERKEDNSPHPLILFDKDLISSTCTSISNSSGGPDNFAASLVKEIIDVISSFLSVIYTKCYNMSYVPNRWKQARAIALYKKNGDPQNIDNYRCIQVTNIFMRVYENLVLNFVGETINLVITKKQPWQYGFRPGCSTSDCIYLLLEDIKYWLSHGYEYPVVFLDIKKAYDRVWHEGLLYKLYTHFGFYGLMLKWLWSYLCFRCFKLIFREEESSWISSTSGVPQGGVLSPVLFNAYMIDFPVHPECKVNLYADDSNVRPQKGGLEGSAQLQKNLNEINTWLIDWRLEISVTSGKVSGSEVGTKSNVVVFKSNRGRPREEKSLLPEEEIARTARSTFTVGNIILPVSLLYKYLGLILHSSLSWKYHLDFVYSKCLAAKSGIMKLIVQYHIGPKATLQLVKTIIFPKITYAMEFWCFTAGFDKKLESVFLAPLRRTLGLSSKTSKAHLFSEFRIIPLVELQKLLVYKFLLRMETTLTKNPIHFLPFSEMFKFLSNRAFHPRPGGQRESVPLYLHSFHFICNKVIDELDCYRFKYAQIKKNLTTHWRLGDFGQLHESDMKVPSYFYVDNSIDLPLRSRLRFDMAKLNNSLFKRHIHGIISNSCPFCPPVCETVEHVIVVCKAYRESRELLRTQLDSIGYLDSITRELVLGNMSPVPHRKAELRDAILYFTLSFLKSVWSIRKY